VVHERGDSGKTVLHAQGTDKSDGIWIDSFGDGAWRVDMPQAGVTLSADSSPAPAHPYSTGYYAWGYVDYTGDGRATEMDESAVYWALSHPQAVRQNPVDRFDVSGDGVVSPVDALIVINALHDVGEQITYPADASGEAWLDVSGDVVVSVLDAQQVLDK